MHYVCSRKKSKEKLIYLLIARVEKTRTRRYFETAIVEHCQSVFDLVNLLVGRHASCDTIVWVEVRLSVILPRFGMQWLIHYSPKSVAKFGVKIP